MDVADRQVGPTGVLGRILPDQQAAAHISPAVTDRPNREGG